MKRVFHATITGAEARAMAERIAEQRIAETTVWVCLCVEVDGSTTPHIFSTPERAKVFADGDPRQCVIYDYVIDHPERMESVPQ